MTKRILQPVLPSLVFSLLATPCFAQMTGVSHPDPDVTETSPAQQSDHYVKPSPATPAPAPIVQAYPQSFPATGPIPATAPTVDANTPAPGLIPRQPEPASPESDSSYHPYRPAESASVRPARLANEEDEDNGVVTGMALHPHELNLGTVLKARLIQTISTETTTVGAPFTAELTADSGHSGEVLLPAGSVIHGHVASIHGGRRIGGLAAIRLQPESVSLPDGTSYPLRATVADLDGFDDVHVTGEGVIQPRTHPKATVGVLGFTTVTATVAGAMIGGGVGAVVGATVGAGLGGAWWLKKDHQETLPAGTSMLFSLDEPLMVTPR